MIHIVPAKTTQMLLWFSPQSIRCRSRELGLKKCQDVSPRLDPFHRTVGQRHPGVTLFPPPRTPANEGCLFSVLLPPRSRNDDSPGARATCAPVVLSTPRFIGDQGVSYPNPRHVSGPTPPSERILCLLVRCETGLAWVTSVLGVNWRILLPAGNSKGLFNTELRRPTYRQL